jgi:hypothetical protein
MLSYKPQIDFHNLQTTFNKFQNNLIYKNIILDIMHFISIIIWKNRNYENDWRN